MVFCLLYFELSDAAASKTFYSCNQKGCPLGTSWFPWLCYSVLTTAARTSQIAYMVLSHPIKVDCASTMCDGEL